MVYKANEYVLYIPKARFVAVGMVKWNLKSGSTDCTPSMVEWRHMIGSYASCKITLLVWFLIQVYFLSERFIVFCDD